MLRTIKMPYNINVLTQAGSPYRHYRTLAVMQERVDLLDLRAAATGAGTR